MQNRTAWLNERRKGLGGSDSPVVLGASRFRSMTELWYDKKGLQPEEPETPDMMRGNVLEPIAADLYHKKTGRMIFDEPKILQDKKTPCMLANIDRWVVADGLGAGVLEIKCPRIQTFGKVKREGLTPEYQIQLQHYLAVTGAEWGAFAIFNADAWELLTYDIERDDLLIEQIREKDAEFWHYVNNSDQPPIDPPVEVDLPKVEGQVLTIDSPEFRETVERFKIAHDLKAEVTALDAEVKEEVQGFMVDGDSYTVEGFGARFYWNMSNGRETIDKKKLQAEYPDAYKACLKRGKPFRTFRSYFLRG